MDCYAEFAIAIKQFINIAHRLCAGLGLPVKSQPLDPDTGLVALAAAQDETSIKWEQVLMIGNPDTIMAARDWRHIAWHLEWFARGLRDDPAEFTQALEDSGAARQRFYAAVRAELAIASGEIPAPVWPPAWLQPTQQQPD